MNSFFIKCLLLGLAAIIQGFAMAAFLFPHFIPSGGAAGISVIVNYLWHVPHAVSLWTVNAGMLIAAVKWLGKSRAIWTMYCVTVTSTTVNMISSEIHHPISNVIIDLTIGSIIFGIGVGILFRLGASSGGMDILALLISKFNGIAPGKALFWINSIILLVTGIVVDWKIILYAVVCQWIGTKVLDLIYKLRFKTIYSFSNSKQS